MGFPKIKGISSGVPLTRIRIYWGLYWGPPHVGKLAYRRDCQGISAGLPHPNATSAPGCRRQYCLPRPPKESKNGTL